MSDLHPLFREHGWTANTGPVRQFNTEVTNALRLGLLSLLVIGPSGAGKTIMAYDLFLAFANGDRVVPWRASAVGIRTVADTPKFYRSFEPAGAPRVANNRLPVLSDQERVVNSILLSCDERRCQQVVLFIDEAQELMHPTLVSLKATVQRLAEKGVQTLALLMAEPDIVNKPVELLRRPGGGSLVRRFFSNRHKVEGLKQDDLGMLLDHMDNASWPANGGPKYTEYFAPHLFRSGWRLKDQTALLWNEFERVAKAMHVAGEGLQVLPCHAIVAIRHIMKTLQQEEKQASAIRDLVQSAVHACGFIEMQENSKADDESSSGKKSKPSKAARGRA